ncbi:hypothetical protein CFC21_086013 [Triticum aestivum]|uniref:NPH3 domain-containing protein n=2 Tax=Triticum aestivum TaxID=4565 RepID=A0A9R1IEC1_WHEAT|nr:hypothetical protein CFC21_086013 [Triticum aestivum]
MCTRPTHCSPQRTRNFFPQIILSQTLGPIVYEVFTLQKDQVSTLKHICAGGSMSTFSAVSAHVWQCMCLARRLPPNSTTRLAFVANVRRSMVPPLLDGYFGNALINLSVAELVYIARQIRYTISRVNDELVHWAVDYIELALTKRDNRTALGSLPATDMRMISWLGMPFY